MVSLRALTCSGHTRPVVDLAFSDKTEDRSFLISACKGHSKEEPETWPPTISLMLEDGLPMLRQGDTGDWIGTFIGHKGAVWSVGLNADATRAATGGADFSAKIWNAVIGDEIKSFPHKHIVKSVDFSQKSLLTGSNEKILRIFDLENYDAEPDMFSGHTAFIKTALFLPNDQQIVSASDDKTVQIWDVRTRDSVQCIDLPSSPSSIEVSADGTIATITFGKIVSFWDIATWTKKKEYEVPTQVNSASLHPEKSMFVFGGEDLIVYKYNYDTGEELEASKGHFGPIHTIRFSPDGELYASGSEDGTLRLWQTTIGKTYGLWEAVEDEENNQENKPEA